MASPAISPRSGTLFVDFAKRVVEILLKYPFGVDQDIFLMEYYDGNPPVDNFMRDWEWEEFKRAKDYSSEQFNAKKEGWVWTRARHGLLRGQFFYQAVARIENGAHRIIIEYPISERLYIEKTGEWQTRTRSEMRVRVANIEAKKKRATLTGNQGLLQEAEKELDEIIVLAPRLAAIDFDTGLTVQDLRALAKSPRVPRLLQRSVKKTLDAYEKSLDQIRNLAQIVYAIKQKRLGGRP